MMAGPADADAPPDAPSRTIAEWSNLGPALLFASLLATKRTRCGPMPRRCQREAHRMLYALVSPAKRLDFAPLKGFKATQPALLKDTKLLAARTKKLTRPQIKSLMDISPALTQLNYERYQSFDDTNRTGTKPAIFTFAGDVYMGFQAKTLTKDDVTFAQDHVAILSGLYGLLRPLDAIQPYRLEMGSALDTERGEDLYDFWRDTVTAQLNANIRKLKDPTVVNLASDEYWSVVDPKQVKAPIVQAVFKELKAGKATIVPFFAKKARGMMARAIVENRWQTPADMQAFDTTGYRFDPANSDDATMVFVRKSK
jgi:cytoplasmic iron level regulating protein YaaA (DUF328/UPF0246 family)